MLDAGQFFQKNAGESGRYKLPKKHRKIVWKIKRNLTKPWLNVSIEMRRIFKELGGAVMGASVRKIDMATPLNAHQSKMAYQDLLNAEHGKMPILGMDVDGAPTNLISPELLAQNKNEIPPYLQDYAARIPKINNTTAPKPTGAKKDPEAEQAKTPAEAAKKEIENTKAAEDKAAQDKKKKEEADNENMFDLSNLSDDPGERIGQMIGMGIVGGRDYYSRLKNEQTAAQPASVGPASKLETKPEAKLASKPKVEPDLMKDMAPAAEAAKKEHKDKRYSSKLEAKINGKATDATKKLAGSPKITGKKEAAPPLYPTGKRNMGLPAAHP